MTSIVRATTIAAAGLLLAANPGRAQQVPTPKVVYVNTQALLDVAPGRVEAESTYNKQTEVWTAQLNTMSKEIQSMIADYQKFVAQTPPPTAAAKENRQRQIQEKQQAYADSQAAFNQEAQDRQTQLMGPVMQSVRDMLEKIREERGYSLILDAQAVLASDRNLDITDDVVARLKIAAAARRDSIAKTKKGSGSTPPLE